MSENKVHPQWKMIQNLYKTKFGTEPEVIDFIAVKDVLRLCCYGNSSESISKELLMEESYVISILEEYYDFSGWQENLEFDLYSLYRSVKNLEFFESYLLKFALPSLHIKINSVGDLKFAYDICETYEELQELLKDYE